MGEERVSKVMIWIKSQKRWKLLISKIVKDGQEAALSTLGGCFGKVNGKKLCGSNLRS